MQLAELLAAIGEKGAAAVTEISESGAVAFGNLRISGTYAAGRDLRIGRDPGPADEIH